MQQKSSNSTLMGAPLQIHKNFSSPILFSIGYSATYQHEHTHTVKCTLHLSSSSIIWPVWVNDWVFVYELSGCGVESCCCHCCTHQYLFRCAIVVQAKLYIWQANCMPILQEVYSVILLEIIHLQLCVEFPFVEIHCIYI